MSRRTVRAIGLASLLVVSAAGTAGRAGGRAPASEHAALQWQVQHTRAELERARAQTDQLRTQVNDLEQQSATSRARLDARNREIAELQRKLEALPPPREPVSAQLSGH